MKIHRFITILFVSVIFATTSIATAAENSTHIGSLASAALGSHQGPPKTPPRKKHAPQVFDRSNRDRMPGRGDVLIGRVGPDLSNEVVEGIMLGIVAGATQGLSSGLGNKTASQHSSHRYYQQGGRQPDFGNRGMTSQQGGQGGALRAGGVAGGDHTGTGFESASGIGRGGATTSGRTGTRDFSRSAPGTRNGAGGVSSRNGSWSGTGASPNARGSSNPCFDYMSLNPHSCAMGQ